MLIEKKIDDIEGKRKFVMKVAFGLIVVGVGALGFVMIFDGGVKTFFIVLSCFYMIAGGIGMFGACKENSMGIRIGHKLVYFLILLNFVAGFLLGFSAIEMRLYPRTIEDKENVVKDRKSFFFFMFLILSSVAAFSGIYLLLKIAKRLRNYSLQGNSFEMEKV